VAQINTPKSRGLVKEKLSKIKKCNSSRNCIFGYIDCGEKWRFFSKPNSTNHLLQVVGERRKYTRCKIVCLNNAGDLTKSHPLITYSLDKCAACCFPKLFENLRDNILRKMDWRFLVDTLPNSAWSFQSSAKTYVIKWFQISRLFSVRTVWTFFRIWHFFQ